MPYSLSISGTGSFSRPSLPRISGSLEVDFSEIAGYEPGIRCTNHILLSHLEWRNDTTIAYNVGSCIIHVI